MKWKVLIIGDLFDLDELSKSLVDDNLKLINQDNSFFLESNQFENFNSDKEVFSRVQELLPILSGATRLSLRGKLPLKIDCIIRIHSDGHEDEYKYLNDSISLRGSVVYKTSNPDGTMKIIRPADNIPNWLSLSQKDQKVATVLRLIGNYNYDWVNLYRIYEIIENDVGGIDQIERYGWASINKAVI